MRQETILDGNEKKIVEDLEKLLRNLKNSRIQITYKIKRIQRLNCLENLKLEDLGFKSYEKWKKIDF